MKNPHCRSCNSPADRSGLTLIDLVVTILVIAIGAAVTAPRIGGTLEAYRVCVAADHLVADLNYARRYARLKSTNCTAVFTTTPPSYILTGVPASNRSGGDHTVNFSDLGYGVTFASVDFDGSSDVTFDQFGRPFTAGGTSPLTDGTVTVQAGAAIATVAVHPATGKASVQ